MERAARFRALVGRQLSHLGRLAAPALSSVARVGRAALEKAAPVFSALQFVLSTVAQMVAITAALLAIVAVLLRRAAQLIARRLPHPHTHIPRSDIEVAVLAGSITIGLLVGAAFSARELTRVPTSEVAAAPAPVVDLALPTATPTPVVKPIADAPLRTSLLPRLKIPELKVDAPLEPVGLAAGGAMGVPTDGETVVWYSLGPFPGSPGNALLAGHVDWAKRAAVFNRLKELAPGSRLSLDFDLGADLDYRVTWVEQYRVHAAPLARIFDSNVGSALTLITCGGPFDNNSRQYLDRVVVRAVRA